MGEDLGDVGLNALETQDQQEQENSVPEGEKTTNKEEVEDTSEDVDDEEASEASGRLGQIQIDTTTATAYMCTAVDTVTPSYTWKALTA